MRTVGFAARAAYLLGTYHPALEGIYLAFSNAGYAASLVNKFIVTSIWCAHHTELIMSLFIVTVTAGEPSPKRCNVAAHTPPDPMDCICHQSLMGVDPLTLAQDEEAPSTAGGLGVPLREVPHCMGRSGAWIATLTLSLSNVSTPLGTLHPTPPRPPTRPQLKSGDVPSRFLADCTW